MDYKDETVFRTVMTHAEAYLTRLHGEAFTDIPKEYAAKFFAADMVPETLLMEAYVPFYRDFIIKAIDDLKSMDHTTCKNLLSLDSAMTGKAKDARSHGVLLVAWILHIGLAHVTRYSNSYRSFQDFPVDSKDDPAAEAAKVAIKALKITINNKLHVSLFKNKDARKDFISYLIDPIETIFKTVAASPYFRNKTEWERRPYSIVTSILEEHSNLVRWVAKIDARNGI